MALRNYITPSCIFWSFVTLLVSYICVPTLMRIWTCRELDIWIKIWMVVGIIVLEIFAHVILWMLVDATYERKKPNYYNNRYQWSDKDREKKIKEDMEKDKQRWDVPVHAGIIGTVNLIVFGLYLVVQIHHLDMGLKDNLCKWVGTE